MNGRWRWRRWSPCCRPGATSRAFRPLLKGTRPVTAAEQAPVLVTGGSGFIGGALVDALVAAGRPVRALARSADAAQALRGRGAEPVTGDVLDPASLARAAQGCSVVYHAAGVNAFCLADPTPMERVNVDGSANVVAAAAAAGVSKVVYTSSAAAIGEVTRHRRQRELSPPRLVPVRIRADEVPGRAAGAARRGRARRGGRVRQPVVGAGPRAAARHRPAAARLPQRHHEVPGGHPDKLPGHRRLHRPVTCSPSSTASPANGTS